MLPNVYEKSIDAQAVFYYLPFSGLKCKFIKFKVRSDKRVSSHKTAKFVKTGNLCFKLLDGTIQDISATVTKTATLLQINTGCSDTYKCG